MNIVQLVHLLTAAEHAADMNGDVMSLANDVDPLTQRDAITRGILSFLF